MTKNISRIQFKFLRQFWFNSVFIFKCGNCVQRMFYPFFWEIFHKLCAIPTNSALWDSARNWIYQIFGRINICGEEREMLGCYRWFHLYPELNLRRKKGILRFDKKNTSLYLQKEKHFKLSFFMKSVSQNPSLQLVIIPMSDQNPNWNSSAQTTSIIIHTVKRSKRLFIRSESVLQTQLVSLHRRDYDFRDFETLPLVMLVRATSFLKQRPCFDFYLFSFLFTTEFHSNFYLLTLTFRVEKEWPWWRDF